MQLLPANGSRTIAPEENCPASPPPTLKLTLILTMGNFPRRNCPDTLLIWMNHNRFNNNREKNLH